jgi:hypothetical protein
VKPYIDAIKAMLAGLGYAVYFVDVPTAPALPYVLLWSPATGLPLAETSVAPVGDFTTPIGVTTVAANPDAVLIATSRVNGALDGAQPAVAGRVVWLNLTDAQPVAPDRDVTPHVAYGVGMYRLISTPA